MGLERNGLVLAPDFGRDLHSLCVFGFGGTNEAPSGFFHQPDHQFGACLRDSASSLNFWGKRKNDSAILPRNLNYTGFSADLSPNK